MKPDKIEKITMPLTIETKFGEFRLEPLAKIKDIQEFEVKFKFYSPLFLSSESIFAALDIKEFIKLNCILLLKEALK